MSCSDDYSDDMFDSSLDDAFEAALSGSSDPDGSPVECLVAQIRSREQTPPQANRALSVLLTHGLQPGEESCGATAVPPLSVRSAVMRRTTTKRLSTRLAATSIGVKVLLGASMAVAAVGGSGAAGVLPDAVQVSYDRVVSGQADGGGDDIVDVGQTGPGDAIFVAVDTDNDTRTENFGDRVSPDARGEDGTNGVDGQTISEEAKQNGRNAEDSDDGEESEAPDDTEESEAPDDIQAPTDNFGDRVSPDARAEDGTNGVDGQTISEEAKQNGANGQARAEEARERRPDEAGDAASHAPAAQDTSGGQAAPAVKPPAAEPAAEAPAAKPAAERATVTGAEQGQTNRAADPAPQRAAEAVDTGGAGAPDTTGRPETTGTSNAGGKGGRG